LPYAGRITNKQARRHFSSRLQLDDAGTWTCLSPAAGLASGWRPCHHWCAKPRESYSQLHATLAPLLACQYKRLKQRLESNPFCLGIGCDKLLQRIWVQLVHRSKMVNAIGILVTTLLLSVGAAVAKDDDTITNKVYFDVAIGGEPSGTLRGHAGPAADCCWRMHAHSTTECSVLGRPSIHPNMH
jgi:hypothetical protein